MGGAMATIGTQSCFIAFDELEHADEKACAMLGMDREQVMEEFDDVYEDTRATCAESFECRALYRGFAVASIEGDDICLEGGVTLHSPELASMLSRADEVVMYAVTCAGYEELANGQGVDPFDSMFFNAWGVGCSMAAHDWVKRAIAARAAEAGRFAGRGWAPGEGAVEPELQQVLFDALDPSQIGVQLVGGTRMHPVMTITGFMGLSSDPSIQDAGADRIQNH